MLKQTPVKEEVVAEAVLNLAEQMKISNAELADVLGVNESTINRLKKAAKITNSRAIESALFLVRIYRSLYSVYSGNKSAMIHWLRTGNKHLHGTPIELMGTMDGLVRTMYYLDAMRGKL